jgi:hypothetical protein
MMGEREPELGRRTPRSLLRFRRAVPVVDEKAAIFSDFVVETKSGNMSCQLLSKGRTVNAG